MNSASERDSSSKRFLTYKQKKSNSKKRTPKCKENKRPKQNSPGSSGLAYGNFKSAGLQSHLLGKRPSSNS